MSSYLTVRLSSKGQIALPKSIRDRMGIERGAELEVSMNEDGQIVLSKKVEPGFFDGFMGLLEGQSAFASGDEAREFFRMEESPPQPKTKKKK